MYIMLGIRRREKSVDTFRADASKERGASCGDFLRGLRSPASRR